MRAELESEGIGQCVFEDEFLFDRTIEALRRAEGSGGLEFERPVALLADVRALKEAEQVLGVERIEGIVRLCRLGRLIVVGCGNGRSSDDRKRDGERAKSTEVGMTSAQNFPPSLGRSLGRCEARANDGVQSSCSSGDLSPASALESRL
jgi:hypothetical protein